MHGLIHQDGCGQSDHRSNQLQTGESYREVAFRSGQGVNEYRLVLLVQEDQQGQLLHHLQHQRISVHASHLAAHE